MFDERDYERASLLVELAVAREIDATQKALSGAGSGVCEDCGIDIAPARLAAYPAATRCVSCQSDHEWKGRNYGA